MQGFSKESFCDALVTAAGENVDYIAIFVGAALQITLLSLNSNEDLIQVPLVAQPSLSSLQSPSMVETTFFTPLPDRFIGHADAALGEKILDIPETQAEAMIGPRFITDDLGKGKNRRSNESESLFMTPVFQFSCQR